MAVSGIVLAGGRSVRMGTDKTQLAWGRHTLLEQAVSLLRGITDEVLVVGNLEGTYCLQGVRQVKDRYAGRGPFRRVRRSHPPRLRRRRELQLRPAPRRGPYGGCGCGAPQPLQTMARR